MEASRALAELDGGPRPVKPSIFVHLEEGLQLNPDDPALIVSHQPVDHLRELLETDSESRTGPHNNQDIRCLTLTFKQLHQAALKLAKGLLANGIETGMTIATFIPNGAEYALLLWTCAILKVTMSNLDSGALDEPRREELKNFMITLRPHVVIVPDTEGAAAVDEVAKAVDAHVSLRLVLAKPSDGSWQTVVDLGNASARHNVDEQALLSSAREDDPRRTASILFTSGTSASKPKGCPRSVAMGSFVLDAQASGLLGRQSHVLVSSANFRIIAPMRTMAAWKEGAAVVIPGAVPTAKAILDCIEEYGISSLLFVPTTLHAIAADPSFAQRNVTSIRCVKLGGDMITKTLMQKPAAAFPDAVISVGHGMTEGGTFYTWPFSQTPVDELPFFGEIAPLGTINKGARIKLWNADDNRVAYRGEPGELHACSAAIITHYLGHTNVDSFYRDEKGDQWFKTGDLGMVNEQGVVYILGRIKDVIKRASIPITPAALESSIEEYTGSEVCDHASFDLVWQ